MIMEKPSRYTNKLTDYEKELEEHIDDLESEVERLKSELYLRINQVGDANKRLAKIRKMVNTYDNPCIPVRQMDGVNYIEIAEGFLREIHKLTEVRQNMENIEQTQLEKDAQHFAQIQSLVDENKTLETEIKELNWRLDQCMIEIKDQDSKLKKLAEIKLRVNQGIFFDFQDGKISLGTLLRYVENEIHNLITDLGGNYEQNKEL